VELLGLLALPLFITVGAAVAFKHTITLKEALAQLAAVTLIIVGAFFIARYCSLTDTEHLHGRITKKLAGDQKCCHCRDVCDHRDKNGSCTSSHEECDHFQDYWWSLETTLGRIGVDDCENRRRAA